MPVRKLQQRRGWTSTIAVPLFHNPVLGGFLRAAGHVPVERLAQHAVGAFDAAVECARRGECVVVHPAGTLTRDPDLWPMVGRTGAARIVLETGCPVIPVGQWGAQGLLPPYSAKLRVFPRQRNQMKAGDPVDLSDLLTAPRSSDLVADLRGGQPPAEQFDPRASGVRQTGNPRKQDRG